MYQEEDLVRIAKRRNNSKRTYLVVNRLQGKHIPVSGKCAFEMFDQLAEIIQQAYKGERLLLIGFAETATAIGARVAVKVGSLYMQTTREQIEGVEYLYFSEKHSHATKQKLVKDDVDSCINDVDRIIFIEDEVTTGNTISQIVNIIREKYKSKLNFSVASILNGMDEQSKVLYEKENIKLHYLVKTDHSKYSEKVLKYKLQGKYMPPKENVEHLRGYNQYEIERYMNARRLVKAIEYEQACEYLWGQIQDKVEKDKKRILVIGTEEFMYPALYVAARLEQYGYEAVSHSTTRSPIEVFEECDYPFHTAFQLVSLYDKERVTYLYDISKYDQVFVVTDALEKENEKSLINVLQEQGNENITVVRWKK